MGLVRDTMAQSNEEVLWIFLNHGKELGCVQIFGIERPRKQRVEEAVKVVKV